MADAPGFRVTDGAYFRSVRWQKIQFVIDVSAHRYRADGTGSKCDRIVIVEPANVYLFQHGAVRAWTSLQKLVLTAQRVLSEVHVCRIHGDCVVVFFIGGNPKWAQRARAI